MSQSYVPLTLLGVAQCSRSAMKNHCSHSALRKQCWKIVFETILRSIEPRSIISTVRMDFLIVSLAVEISLKIIRLFFYLLSSFFLILFFLIFRCLRFILFRVLFGFDRCTTKCAGLQERRHMEYKHEWCNLVSRRTKKRSHARLSGFRLSRALWTFGDVTMVWRKV